MNSQKAIFISHAWGGVSDDILAHLVKRLKEEEIAYILDKRDLSYRQSIQEFMIQLGKADMVIIILSNKYLKSEYCMFELIQIYKNENLRERIYPIVLDEVQISSSADRLEFVKFWENQLIALQNKIKELNSLSFIEGITEDLNLYSEIRNNIARLTGILRDINTLNIQIHQDSDYHHLIAAIKHKINPEPTEKILPPPVPVTKVAPENIAQTNVAQTNELQPRIAEQKGEEQKANEQSAEKPKVEKQKVEKQKPVKQKVDPPNVVPPKPVRPKIIQKKVVQQRVIQADLDHIIVEHAKTVNPKSTLFTHVNIKFGAILLLVIVGFFVMWKLMSKSNATIEDEFSRTGGGFPDTGISFYSLLNGVFRDSIAVYKLESYQRDGYPDDEFRDESYPVETYQDENSNLKSKPSESYRSTTLDKPFEFEQTTPAKKQERNIEIPTNENQYQTNPSYKLTIPKDEEQEKIPDGNAERIADLQQQTSSTTQKSDPVTTYKPMKFTTILKGTSLTAKSSSSFSSDDPDPVPRRVNFALDKAVFDGSNIAIPVGSIIFAKIVRVKKSEYRRIGSLDLAFEYLLAPDGQKIPLQSDEMHLEARGDSPYQVAVNMKFQIKTSSNVSIKY